MLVENWRFRNNEWKGIKFPPHVVKEIDISKKELDSIRWMREVKEVKPKK